MACTIKNLLQTILYPLFFCLTISASVNSEDVRDKPEPLKTFKAKDIFNLEYVADPQISPDGRQIVYVRRSHDIMSDSMRSNLWLVNSDGTNHRPLAVDTNNHYSPRWSPNGDRIAFISNTSGRSQIHVRWMDSFETALLTNLQKSPSHLSWSPDGHTLAFTMLVPARNKPLDVTMPVKPKGAQWSPPVKYISKARYQRDGQGIIDTAYTHVFTVPSLGGTARQLTKGDFNHSGALSWSDDASEIYFSANRHTDWEYESRESDIFAVNVQSLVMRQVTDTPGAEYSPRLSPDGKHLAYIQMDNQKLAYRPTNLIVTTLDGADKRTLAADLDREISNLQWSSNRTLYFSYETEGLTNVAAAKLSGKVTVRASDLGGQVMGRPYTSGDYNVHIGGSDAMLAVTKGTPTSPADLYVVLNGGEQKITDLNSDIFAGKTMGAVHELKYTSSFDGENIQGWYVTPPGFDPSKKYPMILEIHGGPHASYGPNFSAEIQRYASEGYVVFYDNHRGSTSYGERFALLLQNKYSSIEDYADHDSGVNAMISKGFIDPERVFITGGSAGGIASAYAIGLTDRYRAAAVAKPVINWLSKVLTADSYLYQVPNQFPGMPWDHMEHYWQRSPLSLVGNVKTPTLLITGENDRRTPISETEQFYQALKLRRVDTVMVRVPGSPHGIAGKPSRMIAKIENILAWFKRYDKKNG